jgi:hypothetical protein|tara:strand:+ start:4438 stop:4689 length:252 start_codon:yes stop_codon:yes gene_type:complete
MVYDQRRAHSPICFPVAPFIIFAHDTNDNGPAADGFYIAYLFGVHSLGERITWTCGFPASGFPVSIRRFGSDFIEPNTHYFIP